MWCSCGSHRILSGCEGELGTAPTPELREAGWGCSASYGSSMTECVIDLFFSLLNMVFCFLCRTIWNLHSSYLSVYKLSCGALLSLLWRFLFYCNLCSTFGVCKHTVLGWWPVITDYNMCFHLFQVFIFISSRYLNIQLTFELSILFYT